jgi:hypothetical protein
MTLNAAGYTIVVPLLNLVILGLLAASALISVIATMKIVQRAGYNGWWVLIIFVPIANMLAFWYFAFSPWPMCKTPERTR